MEVAEENVAVDKAVMPAPADGDVEMKSDEIPPPTKATTNNSSATHNNDVGEADGNESEAKTDGDGDEEESSEGSDGKGAVEEPPLATRRPRRENAGNRMAELMSQSDNLLSTIAVADEEAKEDNEFYGKLAYGGFHEIDKDDDFMEKSEDGSDEDSDEFATDEEDDEEDEGEGAGEEDEERTLRRERRRTARQRIIEKNRKWAEARFEKAANAVEENSCDAKTQQQRLREAKKTEAANTQSLANFQEIELERKKRQNKRAVRPEISGPTIRYIMEPDQSRVLIVPTLADFPKPEQQKTRVCAVTGKRAKYVDPLTGLPYADVGAFSMIRQKYKEYVDSLSTNEDNNTQ